LSEDVVDGVDWHPHHGGEADAQANDLSPFRVVVVGAVLNGLVGVAVKSKDRLKAWKSYFEQDEAQGSVDYVDTLWTYLNSESGHFIHRCLWCTNHSNS
jgi:hypothetical protein